MRVIIVGAGIAGLAAAKGLRLLGWDVEIYEQAPELKPLGAGLSLSANALRALGPLNLYDAVIAKAQPIHRFDLLNQKGGVLQSTDFQRFSRRYGHLSMAVLHRGDLHRALLSDLPRSVIYTGMECVDARQADGHALLTFANGKTIDAELVLACDGIHSAVRRALIPESREHFANYTCWRGVAQGIPSRMDPKRLTESWGAGRRFGLAAMPGNRTYWFACCGAERVDDPGLAKVGLDALKVMFSAFHDPVAEVLGKTSADSVIWTDIIDLDPMPSFTRGRVVLLGDAAHAVTPDLGQGAGLAIEDAAVLAALFGRYPIEQVFREYDARRVERARRITIESRRYARIAQWQHPLVVPLRSLLLKSIPEQVMERQLDAVLNISFEPVKAAA